MSGGIDYKNVKINFILEEPKFTSASARSFASKEPINSVILILYLANLGLALGFFLLRQLL